MLSLWGGWLAWHLTIGLVLVTVALWKARPLSFKALADRIFPSHLYRNFSASITARHFLLYLPFRAPLYRLLPMTPPFASAAVNGFLRGSFGQRETVLHTPWAVPTVQAGVIIVAMGFACHLYHHA